MNLVADELARTPLWQRQPVQLLIVLIVSALVYLPLLGQNPLRSTEGHRVVPASEMLETGEWLVPHMFEFPYLRKPPGMPWVIAASTAVFGAHEFAYRLPSALGAIVMAMAVWWYATRWFGSPFGLGAGLVQALAPAWWRHARSAEIDPLLFAATQLAVLAIVDLATMDARRRCSDRHTPSDPARDRPIAQACILGAALAAAIFLKGPVTLPVLAAAACAIAFTFHPRSLLRVHIPVAITIGLAIPFALLSVGAPSADTVAVRQGVSAFLFKTDELVEALTMPLQVFAVCVPASLAFLFPWGPDARREHSITDVLAIARVLALTFVIALIVYAAVGAHALRYVLPAAVTLSPMVAYVLLGLSRGFTPGRRRIARMFMLGHPLAWLFVLFAAAMANTLVLESSRAVDSARPDARELSAFLMPSSVVIADSQIDTRPELLHYLEDDAGVRGLWRPDLIGTSLTIDAPALPQLDGFSERERAAGVFMLLRDDELARFVDAGFGDRLREIMRLRPGESTRDVVLLRVTAAGDTMPLRAPERRTDNLSRLMPTTNR